MNWKLKASIGNAVSLLPSTLSYGVHSFVQRHFGRLRNTNPIDGLWAGSVFADLIRGQNRSVESQLILEVGTGYQLNVQIGMWLCGVPQIVTVDLNPYLKLGPVLKDIADIRENREQVLKVFGDHVKQPLFQSRLESLLMGKFADIQSILNFMNIRYLAPADATCLDLAPGSVDCHISHTVMEHIPPGVILQILNEGKRVLKKDGLFIHEIDFSDHFACVDQNISSINFLQFSEAQWEKYSGNRYAYHNRLRIDEFLDLFDKAGLDVISVKSHVDPRALDEIRKGMHIDARFRGKSPEVNASVSAWVVAATRPDH